MPRHKYNTPPAAKDIHAILHLPTNKFISFGAKAAWNGSGPAKSAFNLHVGEPMTNFAEYELVNLTEAYYVLEGLNK